MPKSIVFIPKKSFIQLFSNNTSIISSPLVFSPCSACFLPYVLDNNSLLFWFRLWFNIIFYNLYRQSGATTPCPLWQKDLWAQFILQVLSPSIWPCFLQRPFLDSKLCPCVAAGKLYTTGCWRLAAAVAGQSSLLPVHLSQLTPEMIYNSILDMPVCAI